MNFVWMMLAVLVQEPTPHADLTLAPIFSDHMIFQREEPIALWGTAKPGSVVQVQLLDERSSINASKDGQWRIELAPRPAIATPLTLRITSGDHSLQIDDVLVGEVWLCAGQSNMEFPLSRDVDYRDATLDRDPLRLFQARYTATGAGGRFDADTIRGLSKESFFKGTWTPSSDSSAPDMSAVAWYFGQSLQEEIGVPIGLIDLAAGGTPTEAWVSREALGNQPDTQEIVTPGNWLESNWLENPALGTWCRKRARENLSRAIEQGEPIPGDDLGPNHAFKPAFMWETAVLPWTHFPIRGVLWYQGESNAGSPERVRQHGSLFPLLIDDWRVRFNAPEMPFLFVQLPAMGRPDWPLFREQQRALSLEISRVGMAVTIDVGHPTDVHPRNKRPVGERLKHLAMNLAYGVPGSAAGPRALTASRDGQTIVVRFDQEIHTSDGNQVLGLEWLDHQGPHPSSAIIVDQTVVLDLPKDADPVEVRYAWAPVPMCNLTDARSLPASPFRIGIDR